jgi:site-specific recombinase XerD
LPLIEEALARPHAPPSACVSVSTRGEPWAEGSLLHAFSSVLRKAKLPAARMHDLRHFFVTECFRAGAPAPDVQQLAGHLSLKVTQRYAHADEESQRASMAAFSTRIATRVRPRASGHAAPHGDE